MLKYKCLILDYDDTAVMSTPQLHYPSFQLIMQALRPEFPVKYSLADFITICSERSFTDFCRNELHFTEEELVEEYKIWKNYIKDKYAEFYEGFIDVIKDYQKAGGIVCCVSLSDKSDIELNYARYGVKLDMVFGWELPEELRKPNTYAVERILEKFNLKGEDCLALDDLKLCCGMLRPFGIKLAAAGWSHGLVPEIREDMKKYADFYLNEVSELRDLIFE